MSEEDRLQLELDNFAEHMCEHCHIRKAINEVHDMDGCGAMYRIKSNMCKVCARNRVKGTKWYCARLITSVAVSYANKKRKKKSSGVPISQSHGWS